MTDCYGVMGHPIAHSKSPYIHARFAAQTDQDLGYRAIHVEPGNFQSAVREFEAALGRGLNITLPFKQEAWELVSHRSDRAEQAGAVNTISFDDGVRGDNTDGIGLVRDLVDNCAATITGKRVLMIGAGGAARGALGALLGEGPGSMVIANRTFSRARELATLFREHGTLEARPFDALKGLSFDLLINATSASLSGQVPPIPDGVISERGTCYDMMYASQPTAFVRWARKQGAANAVDGLGMLVEQAAESFYIWRSIRPRTQPVLSALRAEISG